MSQKIGQTVSTHVLKARWRKDQILEAYLNLVPFRGELVGIDALSRTLFGKAAHRLDEREAAVAAPRVRGPNATAAQVSGRACSVLKLMQSRPDCDSLDLFTTDALQRKAFNSSEGFAPHLARRLVAQTKEQLIQSTLRASLQRFGAQIPEQRLRELRGRHVKDGAIVVLSNATGEVLAWVGSSNQLSQAADLDGVTALRQPDSTLKPFLYAQAIAENRITAASLPEDSSTQIPPPAACKFPQNYDRQFKHMVSTRTALGVSFNVPAVRTLVMVSPDALPSSCVPLACRSRKAETITASAWRWAVVKLRFWIWPIHIARWQMVGVLVVSNSLCPHPRPQAGEGLTLEIQTPSPQQRRGLG